MNVNYRDITLAKYVGLRVRDEYDFALKYGNFEPLDLFKLGSLTECPFGFVKDIQDVLNYEGLTWENFIDEMSKYTRISKRRIAQMSLFDLYRAKLYLKEQVEFINKIEYDGLNHSSTSEEEAAGIDIFEKYHAFIQFDKLTNGDVTKIDAIRKLPYSLCFTKLRLEADKYEFNKSLERIRRPK